MRLDLEGRPEVRVLARGELGFTFCQTPVVYRLAAEPGLTVRLVGGETRVTRGCHLDPNTSREVLSRSGAVVAIEVEVPEAGCKETSFVEPSARVFARWTAMPEPSANVPSVPRKQGTAGTNAAPLIALLLAHGADPDRRDKRGRSARAAVRPGVLTEGGDVCAWDQAGPLRAGDGRWG